MVLDTIIQILSSPAFTPLVILISAIIALWELREIKRSRQINAFLDVYNFLQNEDTRKARGILINLGKSRKKFNDWTPEEINEAEKVSQTYDAVGVMISNKFIAKKLIIKEWRNSIILCWEAAEPMIKKYQKMRGTDFQDDFERLYHLTKKVKIPKKKRLFGILKYQWFRFFNHG